MKKFLLGTLAMTVLLSSCVSQKKYAELEAKHKETQDLLNSATVKLNDCLEEKATADSRLKTLEDQNAFLKANNQELINNMGNLTTLTTKGAENLEKSLESLREKDLTIRKLQDAVTRRDSVNLALVQSLKGVLGNLDDDDIEISVEKGVVFVSISDKLLFRSGSYNVTSAAKEVLGKVAKVVNNKPDFEFMVEGHTDNVPYRSGVLLDNWDLSAKRATSVVRILQNDFGVDPARMTAAGRSYYVPLVSNDTSANRAKNRRTRIVVLPKIDQFYNMIEEGMKDPAIGGTGK
ncbi:MAG: flagellar motor protein MotB [Allomuricauda sp.]|jgi:chemotaxis protein MotB|uniref:OmpA family protein n=1 Tax=Flagellimonas sp. MMG031 TaxID=3158549 RepID=A0AAU7MVD7_9FLAO|nr:MULTISPECIES: OmpA family protein [unclassified Allomuricauda]MBO6589225.1 OmpA family protein [Allomuricauda sp.]MBO6618850.1 OmpA family protein [Allomuricauda sp.]MBO6644763.1 OmpA family protein [Allomuricauda sp.]MBO6746663.1 OmpA family protein [Allomuricauda sp.]MBO6829158.1 OmpA family protein [Allomuricauda sp.]